jgi:hypothetical protein
MHYLKLLNKSGELLVLSAHVSQLFSYRRMLLRTHVAVKLLLGVPTVKGHVERDENEMKQWKKFREKIRYCFRNLS